MKRALRGLRAAPVLAVSAILTLALGTGASITIFSIANGLLLRPLPVAAPDRLAAISSDFAVERGFSAGAGWNFTMFDALEQRAAGFDGVLAWQPTRFTIGHGADSAVADGIYASDGFFITLGVRARRGRLFARDQPEGGEATVVISHALWTTRFGGVPDVVGMPLVVNGAPATISGVLPPDFHGLEAGRNVDVAVSFAAERALRGPNAPLFQPRSLTLLAMVRLKPGQSPAAGTAVLRALQHEIVPPNAPEFAKAPFLLVPAAHASNPGSAGRLYRQSVLILLGGAALLFLASCFSVANLLLARAHGRRREAALRAALGGRAWSIVRPLVVEHALIALAGTVAGLVVARISARTLLALTPVSLDVSLDWRVAAFAGGVSGLTVLLLTLGPVRRLARVQPAAVLNAAGERGPLGAGRLSSGFLIVQVSLALLLTIPAALLVQTFVGLARRPLGLDADRVLIVNIDAARAQTPPAARDLMFLRAADAVRVLPGVQHAALSYWTPVSGGGGLSAGPTAVFPGKPDTASVVVNFVSADWFRTYGIPMRAGRDFGPADSSVAPPAVIVNDAFVRQLLAGTPPVGVTTTGGVIVGVVGDAISRSIQRIPGVTSLAFREPVPPAMFRALAQTTSNDRPRGDAIRLSVRAVSGSPSSLAPAIGPALAAIDPGLAFQFHSLAGDIAEALGQERLSATVATVFGGLAMILALVGVFGVTSDAAARRRSEIGVRMALGATQGGIVRLVLRRALVPIIAGIVIGAIAAAFLTRTIAAQLFGIDARDPTTFIVLSLAFCVLATAFALAPALRASTRDPLTVLQGRE